MKRQYDDPVYKKFRSEVLKRDKKQCQMPGCKSRSNLHVHHIKKWSAASSLRFDPNNGVTLCKYCHNKVNGRERQYEKLFREIVDGKI